MASQTNEESFQLEGDKDVEEGVSVGGSTTEEGSDSVLSKRAPELAGKETRAVTRSRIVVVLVLVAVAVIAGLSVFNYTSAQEELDFETRFKDFGNQVIGVTQVNSNHIKAAYENFALQLTSYAIAANMEWPFVTLPLFEAYGARVLEQTGARTIGVANFVKPNERELWENYTQANMEWRQAGLDYQGLHNTTVGPVPPFIWGDFRNFGPLEGPGDRGFYAPMWQTAPIAMSNRVNNFDTFNMGILNTSYDFVVRDREPTLGEVRNLDWEDSVEFEVIPWPESLIVVPVFDSIEPNNKNAKIVALANGLLPWHNMFQDLLPTGTGSIVLVVSNVCNQTFSYQIDGPNIAYLGVGDFHDPDYDKPSVEADFSPFGNEMSCAHKLSLYPTRDFHGDYMTNKPVRYTVTVAVLFAFMIFVFFVYDCLVERRQTKVLTAAETSTAIVSSLFPGRVANRLLEDAGEKNKQTKAAKPKMMGKLGLKEAGNYNDFSPSELENHDDTNTVGSKAIAELFPSATVLFADISGFTSWSSTREPSQVFELLEHIYSSFDAIAKRRHVFKVETIGDCYMAATGLPEKRKDHAVIMARFARDCLKKMHHVLRRLEVRLGPGTASLGMRVGIHSGPVTAGVLRGDKARFQLFGDTVNTAARIESTGSKNRVQLSPETAEMIQNANVGDIWVIPREDKVEAKGKGQLSTFWLAYASTGTVTSASTEMSSEMIGAVSAMDTFPEIDGASCSDTEEVHPDSEKEKEDRAIDWSVEILARLLKQVLAMRGRKISRRSMKFKPPSTSTTPLDEVVEIIHLPIQPATYAMNPSKIELPPEVLIQLRDYVKTIASQYRSNPFHSFEHATHVMLSVVKLMARVVSPDATESNATSLHAYTYGITSDPLTQFAVAFSALIHDVDHLGVPNSTLVKENTDAARRYKNKSVAEQNSVDLAWELLSRPTYADLRSCICSTEDESRRFRQLVVNAVMATDIVDKELGLARRDRWEKAFQVVDDADSRSSEDSSTGANRKATIVIEHLMQASDVAHTMQHWHVYLRWNECFFRECYKAYKEGRSDTDPSIGWYRGELGFFDFYVIPLAKKLKDCRVFGVASDEYLQYAEANRQEWEVKGEKVVEHYISNYLKEEAGSSLHMRQEQLSGVNDVV